MYLLLYLVNFTLLYFLSFSDFCFTQFTRNRNVRFAGCVRLYPDEDKRLATPLHRLFDGHYRVLYYGFRKTRISVQNPIANKSRSGSVFLSHEVADKIHCSVRENDERKCIVLIYNVL